MPCDPERTTGQWGLREPINRDPLQLPETANPNQRVEQRPGSPRLFVCPGMTPIPTLHPPPPGFLQAWWQVGVCVCGRGAKVIF